MKQAAILILINSIFWVSCSRTTECTGPRIQLEFKGYIKADVDTIILRKYQPGNNYQQLVDTMVVTEKYPIYSVKDTAIQILVSNYPGLEILPGFDWEVFVPAKNRSYYITEISAENKRTAKCPGFSDICVCINKLYSLKMNGQLFTPVNNDIYVNHFILLPF